MWMRRWKDCPATTKLWRLTIAAMVIAGITLIASGVWIKVKAQLAQLLLDQAFAKTLAGEKGVKPWPWADITPVARLSVERLSANSVILAGASGEALAFGPAHLANTPRPGGEGTSVIAAHRDTHFFWIRHLVPGDAIKITGSRGEQRLFRVSGSRVAHFDRSGIDADAFGQNLALTTCYPFDAKTPGPMRYIVEAKLESKL